MYYWLSFCGDDGGFLGACIAEGDTVSQAIKSAWAHGCNPGGEVLSQGPRHPSYPPMAKLIATFGVHQLISWDKLKDYPGMEKLKDHGQEEADKETDGT
jgi:aspartate/methionine/tyrosine aminotransferase